MAISYESLYQKFGIRFQNPEILERALTHSTFAYEHGLAQGDNERLEFLGDAVLQLSVSELLYQLSKPLAEGQMTKIRALLVCENTLASIAEALELGQLLRLGHGEEKTGGRSKASNLADACEAFFAALYLDQGFLTAKTIIQGLVEPYLQQALTGHLVYDYKSRLLEYAQAHKDEGEWRFQIVDEQGPVHQRLFTAAVLQNGQELARATGHSKKEAEQAAAHLVLADLERQTGAAPCI